MKLFKGFAVSLALLMVFILAACGDSKESGKGKDSDTIKIGVLEDQSGDFSLVGIPKLHAVELAVEEINENGGLLGKKVEIVAPDTQSDDKRYQEMAKKLILDDKVDVIMGGYASSSREAIRPLMEQHKMVYFYNNQYEGGVASKYTFPTGAVPEHQVLPVSEYVIKEYGPKIYTIAADYNFGQITADWFRVGAEKFGGEIIGEEFIPLGVSQFSSTISKIKQAKPDVLVVLLVGAAQNSFYEQWINSGIKDLPMATSINMAQVYEHKRFQPPALNKMHVVAPFMEELDTPEAKAFVEKWRAKFPDEQYIGMEAAAQYSGVHMWAKAVEKAGTTDSDAVVEALESGEITFDGPSGKESIDPATHHAIKNMYLFMADENHNIKILDKWDQVEPYWLSKERDIDLRKQAPNQQFTPID